MIDEDILRFKYEYEKKTQKEIGKELNVSSTTIKYWLNKYNIKIRTQPLIPSLIGQKFNQLLVLSRAPNKNHRVFWLCQCDCGHTKEISSTSLKLGKTKSCGCLQKKSVYKGYKNLSGQQWARIKHQAKTRNISFNLSIKDAWHLFQKQDQKCALSGVPIELHSNYLGSVTNNTASLDRIDNQLGYTINNVQWVHKTVNIMKNKLSDIELIEWCQKILEHNQVAN